jgi:hypothetical protein
VRSCVILMPLMRRQLPCTEGSDGSGCARHQVPRQHVLEPALSTCFQASNPGKWSCERRTREIWGNKHCSVGRGKGDGIFHTAECCRSVCETYCGNTVIWMVVVRRVWSQLEATQQGSSPFTQYVPQRRRNWTSTGQWRSGLRHCVARKPVLTYARPCSLSKASGRNQPGQRFTGIGGLFEIFPHPFYTRTVIGVRDCKSLLHWVVDLSHSGNNRD